MRKVRSVVRSRAVLALVAFLMLGAAIPAFGGGPAAAQEDLPEPSTTIRLFHGAPGASDFDLFVDGQPLFRRLTYGEATLYGSVTPGDHEFRLAPTGSGPEAAVVTMTQTVEDGRAHTVVVLGTADAVELKVYRVNLDRPEAGKGRVRVIHASPDAGKLKIMAGEDEWFDDLEYGNASDYRDFIAGSYDLSAIQQEGDEQTLLTAPGAVVNWGTVYDVILFGSVADGSFQPLTLVTSVSPRCSLLLGVGLPNDACLRIANLIPTGLPMVDIYYNGVRIIENVGAGNRTEYVGVPAGYGYEVTLHIVPHGMSTDYALTYRYVDLKPGEAYELFLIGTPNSPWIVADRVNLTPPPTGQARVRLIHAVPDAPNVDVAIKDGPMLFEDVEYEEISDYVILDAGVYAIEVRNAETDEILFEAPAKLEAGVVYDVVAFYGGEASLEAAAPDAATPTAPDEATPTTGDTVVQVQVTPELRIVVFASPTFPRGGIQVPSPREGTDPAAGATPTS
jgi:hypothetical protein